MKDDIRSFADAALDLRPSAGLGRKAVDLAEAKSGACPMGLVVKKGSNTLSIMSSGMPCPRVVHLDPHEFPTGISLARLQYSIGRSYSQSAAVGHSVPRVYSEIENGHFQLRGVGQHAPEVWLDADLDRDVAAERAADQDLHAIQQGAEVDCFRGQAHATSEGKKLTRKCLPALGGLTHALAQALGLVRGAPEHVKAADITVRILLKSWAIAPVSFG